MNPLKSETSEIKIKEPTDFALSHPEDFNWVFEQLTFCLDKKQKINRNRLANTLLTIRSSLQSEYQESKKEKGKVFHLRTYSTLVDYMAMGNFNRASVTYKRLLKTLAKHQFLTVQNGFIRGIGPRLFAASLNDERTNMLCRMLGAESKSGESVLRLMIAPFLPKLSETGNITFTYDKVLSIVKDNWPEWTPNQQRSRALKLQAIIVKELLVETQAGSKGKPSLYRANDALLNEIKRVNLQKYEAKAALYKRSKVGI